MQPVRHEKEEEAVEPPLLIHQGEVKGGEPAPLLPKGTGKEVFAPLTLTCQIQTQGAVPTQTPRPAIREQRQTMSFPEMWRSANSNVP